MYERKVLPFYMTYPLPISYQEENTVLKDLEYLQQMYPADAKRYQKMISDILDRLDYEGSMIYDEYPDRWQLYKLSSDIVERMKVEEKKNPPEVVTSEEKWVVVSDMVRIILYYEIYKRRHSDGRGILKF